MVRKIYIIGGSRNGKSFLGNRLSSKIDIPHFDLDKIVWTKLGETLRDEKDRNEKLLEILKSDKWIIEGVYTEDWVLPALVKADIVIRLELSSGIRLFRFLMQIIKEYESQKYIYARIKLILGLRHGRLDRSRTAYDLLLRPFRGKVITLKSRKDADDFLKKSTNSSGRFSK